VLLPRYEEVSRGSKAGRPTIVGVASGIDRSARILTAVDCGACVSIRRCVGGRCVIRRGVDVRTPVDRGVGGSVNRRISGRVDSSIDHRIEAGIGARLHRRVGDCLVT